MVYQMSAIKKTISIDENIANEASKINSNFSAIVEKALIEYMHHYRVQKAIQSFFNNSRTVSKSVKKINNDKKE